MENIRETFHDHPVYSLSEIAFSLHKVVERTYPQPYFIKAEILKLNFYPHSGHCYPELVEKEGNSIKAEMRAIIWAANYQRINDRFIQITGNPLKENISILCLARIEFSPKHGLALHIEDIEPTYTLGEMVKNRNAVIERLKKEGVFTANKRLEMPLLPKRVAIISVETSKGYSDFITTLNGNRYGYRFVTELFPSILQGDKAIVGITGRLAEIEMRQKEFDCVVIVRGGGGDVGLSCYDEYEMAHRVATFPLPVLTGIGHSTNLSVTDMVAHTYNITPTDVAFALIGYFQTFDEKVQECQDRIVEVSRRLLVDEQAKLLRMTEAARMLPLVRLTEQQGRVGMIEEKVRLLHPENILKRGFSITRHNGKVVTNVADLKSGDELHTQVYEGEMTSIFYASQS
ncbi:MAG: exodeoxyribonuclease VII large subunit [Bacteroidales bacterium]|nr:exodeoxyribonuclease VII large subunit [Bacteroidales bacterium]